jgi:ribosome-binding protein aMBF1 (putative translation factor)
MLRVEFRKTTPKRVLHDVYRRYSRYIVQADENEMVEWKKTALHKEIVAKTTPADYLCNLRTVSGWSLRELGEKIGVTAQRVYDFEKGRRGISKDVAKQLGKLFNISPAVFI